MRGYAGLGEDHLLAELGNVQGREAVAVRLSTISEVVHVQWDASAGWMDESLSGRGGRSIERRDPDGRC